MANDILEALVRANLTGGAAALLLLAFRSRLRTVIGPNAVYALWLTVPAAAFASLLPARTVRVLVQAPAVQNVLETDGQGMTLTAAWDASQTLVGLWLAGAAVAALWVAWRQVSFLTLFGLKPTAQRVVKATSPQAGPAVVGIIRPRILLPADFSARFSPMQRRVVLAHEGVHLSRGDSRINAAVLLLQCLSWFNPVAHLAARAMRLDQELSCDALVMARFPKARRSYAEAMLKSQVSAVALPIGCYWPARGPSALSRRLTMLRVSPVSRARMTVGLSLAALMAASAGMTAWSVQPPRQMIVFVPLAPAPAVLPPSIVRGQVQPGHPAPRQAKSVEHGSSPLNSPAPVEVAARAKPGLARFFEWTAMPMSPEGEPVDVGAVYHGQTAPDGHMANQPVAGQATGTYRNGEYQMKSDFVRTGDIIEISAQLSKSGDVIATGTARVIAGEVAFVSLSNGQMAQIVPGQTAYIITRPNINLGAATAPS